VVIVCTNESTVLFDSTILTKNIICQLTSKYVHVKRIVTV